jgi:hypothetical protein
VFLLQRNSSRLQVTTTSRTSSLARYPDTVEGLTRNHNVAYPTVNLGEHLNEFLTGVSRNAWSVQPSLDDFLLPLQLQNSS